jgi:transposase
MGHLFWPSDDQWAVTEPLLPEKRGGARRVDNRRVISGIVHVLKVGYRWCDCPSDLTEHCHRTLIRHSRWE